MPGSGEGVALLSSKVTKSVKEMISIFSPYFPGTTSSIPPDNWPRTPPKICKRSPMPPVVEPDHQLTCASGVSRGRGCTMTSPSPWTTFRLPRGQLLRRRGRSSRGPSNSIMLVWLCHWIQSDFSPPRLSSNLKEVCLFGKTFERRLDRIWKFNSQLEPKSIQVTLSISRWWWRYEKKLASFEISEFGSSISFMNFCAKTRRGKRMSLL